MASMFSEGKITVSSITTALQASSLASLSDTGINSNNSENASTYTRLGVWLKHTNGIYN